MKTPDTDTLTSIQGLIFDLDGTLVDSRLDFTAIRHELACPEGVGVLEYIASLPEEDRSPAEKIVLQHERRGAERAQWMPGARECLEYCERANLPTAILTRNAREVADLTLTRLGIRVDMMLAREDCAPKPVPDGLLLIADAWGYRLPTWSTWGISFMTCRPPGGRDDQLFYDPQETGNYQAETDWHLAGFEQLTAMLETISGIAAPPD